MNTTYPGYLAPFILIGSVSAVIVFLVMLQRTLKLGRLPVREHRRALWAGGSLLVAWFLTALWLTWLGLFQGVPSRLPTIQFGILTPILAGLAMYRWWPSFRRVVELVPQQWIVGIQAYRLEGAIFLVLYASGWLPGAFALPAGMGDFMVGLAAPFVATAYAPGSARSATRLRTWNLLGILDLVVAVTTGFLTSRSPLQILSMEAPNMLISAFPLAMIPVFLVPLAILLHLASLAKLRRTEVAPAILNQPLAGQLS